MKISDIFLSVGILYWIILLSDLEYPEVFDFGVLLGVAIIIGIIFSLIRHTEKHGIENPENPLDIGFTKFNSGDIKKATKGFYDTVFTKRRFKNSKNKNHKRYWKE